MFIYIKVMGYKYMPMPALSLLTGPMSISQYDNKKGEMDATKGEGGDYVAPLLLLPGECYHATFRFSFDLNARFEGGIMKAFGEKSPSIIFVFEDDDKSVLSHNRELHVPLPIADLVADRLHSPSRTTEEGEGESSYEVTADSIRDNTPSLFDVTVNAAETDSLNQSISPLVEKYGHTYLNIEESEMDKKSRSLGFRSGSQKILTKAIRSTRKQTPSQQ
jgi:hypothetical protein